MLCALWLAQCVMSIRTPLYLIISLCIVSMPARADHVKHSLATTPRLIADCKSDVPALRAMCIGYLAAIADGVARHQKIGSAKRTVCVPENVDIEAFRGAFLQFVTKNPTTTDGHSFEAVQAALEAEWPCQR